MLSNRDVGRSNLKGIEHFKLVSGRPDFKGNQHSRPLQFKWCLTFAWWSAALISKLPRQPAASI
jgi:hypothetical protein